jgi:phosphoribosyl-dephospho-CoA transferase
LGVEYYIGRNCSNIKKSANSVYEIGGHDIYFHYDGRGDIVMHSKKHDMSSLKAIIHAWIEEYRVAQSIITVTFTASGAVARSRPWKSSVTFENRFFENKENIIDQITQFVTRREWYRSKGIPHTCAILLHGEPGCGKTGFIKCVANRWPTKHIINIRLKPEMRIQDLENMMHDVHIAGNIYVPFVDRIYVIEDIECDVGHLLNGLSECDTQLLILTTNRHLDIRPGSININIYFKKATLIELKAIMAHYWDTTHDDIAQFLDSKFSGAEIVNYCRTSATYEDALARMIKEKTVTMYDDITDLYRRITHT